MNMPSQTRRTWPAALIALGLALGAQASEPPPYGHSDFVPTPETPISFRPNNGHYPGATPPLEWWEGTPTERTGTIPDRFNSGKPKSVKLWDFADAKSENIRWKVPVPGWSLSHPIVVGKRVFAVGEPDFVTCYDADTGRQVWQRRIMPLLCDGLPEAKAVAGQKVLDLARAIFLTSGGGASTCGRNPGNVLTYGKGGDNPSSLLPQEIFAKRRDFGDCSSIAATAGPGIPCGWPHTSWL